MVKNKFALAILFSCFLIISLETRAQKDSIDLSFLDSINLDDLFKLKSKKSYFKIQASYLTNSVFAGRKDSLPLPYFTPSIEYNHKSGLYAGASLSYLANSNSRIDLWSLDLGYSFELSKKLNGNLYINKPFYNNSSSNVQSAVSFYAGSSLTYDASILAFTASTNFMFGSENDFSLILTTDHQFNWSDKSNALWTFAPSFNLFLGSSGYYQTYRVDRKNPRNNLPQTVNVTINSPNKFQLMSYEFSTPLYFDKTTWGFFINPTYVIAVNPIVTTYKVTGPFGGTIVPETRITEKISNSFYTTFGAYIKF